MSEFKEAWKKRISDHRAQIEIVVGGTLAIVCAYYLGKSKGKVNVELHFLNSEDELIKLQSIKDEA